MSFVDKVIIITGGSSGIGAATAIAFAKEGANVVIVGRNEEKLNNVIEKCKSAGKKPLSIKADVTHKGVAERIVKETIEAFGKIDVLVNNAGMVKYADILDSNIMETYEITLNTNLRAHIEMTHLAAPFLIKSKGNIVNISSVFAQKAPPNSIMYGVSKAALSFFSRVSAASLASYDVRVNTVSPGPVETDILYNAGLNKRLSELKDLMPLRRVSEPEEIADLIVFLASDKAKGITGSEYITDNGYLSQ